MDLSRAVYSRDLKIAAMRAGAGRRFRAPVSIARKYATEPQNCWSAGAENGVPRGESAFPGVGRRATTCRRWTIAAPLSWNERLAS